MGLVPGNDQRTLWRILSCSRISALNCLMRSRSSIERPPCHKAFFDDVVLPLSVRGPVDFSHGCHCWIKARCRARRSGVQPLPMLHLQ